MQERDKSERATLTVEEAAKLLGISRNSAYEAAHNGTIPSLRIGRRVLIPEDALRQKLNGQDMQNNSGQRKTDPASE